MKSRGMSLLEVVIAAAILVVVLGTMYLVLFASTSLSEKELALRDAEFQLQTKMDQIAKDLRESSQTLVRVHDFIDAEMPTTAQSLIAMPSGWDDSSQFQVTNAQVEWQRLIVYAPYYDPVLKDAQLRRYVVSPIPEEFKDAAVAPTITVTATELQLGSSTVVARSEGEKVFMKFDALKAATSGNSITVDLSVQGGRALSRNVTLASEIKGRN